MANKPGTLEQLARELAQALAVLEERLAPTQALRFFNSLGVRFPQELMDQPVFTGAASAAVTAAAGLSPIISDLFAAIEAEDDARTLIESLRLLAQIRAVLDAVDNLATQLRAIAASLPEVTPGVVQEFADALRFRVLELLVVEHLERRLPNPTALLAVFGIVERTTEPGDPDDPTKPPFVSKRLHLARIVDALRSPVGQLQSRFAWGDPAFDGEALLDQIAQYLTSSGLAAELRAATATTPLAVVTRIFEIEHDAGSIPPGLTVVSLLDLLDGLDLTMPLAAPGWSLQLTVRGRFESGLEASIVPPAKITLTPPSPPLQGELLIRIVGTSPEPERPFVLLSQTATSRLEAASLGFTFGLKASADPGGISNCDLLVQIELTGARAVLDTAAGDGFVTDMTSSSKLQGTFGIRAAWSLQHGLTFEGSSALEIRIPQHVSLGPIELRQIFLVSDTAQEGVPLEVSAELRARLGPLTVDIQRIGFKAVLTFPDTENGGLPVDLGFGFKPPSGLGLSVDGGGFKGGGFLGFEPEASRYSGMLELQFQDQFTLKAFGVLETKLPGGEPGFSLILVISAEFTPIQLGFGFTLNGVGGLLGLHRTANVDRLVSGLRDSTLSQSALPRRIVANAERILSDLRQVFPAARRAVHLRSDGEDRLGHADADHRGYRIADRGARARASHDPRCDPRHPAR